LNVCVLVLLVAAVVGISAAAAGGNSIRI